MEGDNMSERKLHPLRGGSAVLGGTIAGLGVGLATGDPAAGVLGGLGLGLMVGGVLRAYGRW